MVAVTILNWVRLHVHELAKVGHFLNVPFWALCLLSDHIPALLGVMRRGVPYWTISPQAPTMPLLFTGGYG